MEPVSEIVGRAVPLNRSDVDTDQIIPSDWLKRVERTGFGEGLFSEWRESSDFVLNRPEYQGDDSFLGRKPGLQKCRGVRALIRIRACAASAK